MSNKESDLEKARKKLAMLDGGNQFGSGGFYDSSNGLYSEDDEELREGFKNRRLKHKHSDESIDDTSNKISRNVDISAEEAKIIIDEFETTKTSSAKSYKSKLRRNKVMISVLLILLIASLTTLIVAYIFLNLDKTCTISIQGDSKSVECIVDGYAIKSFRVPARIRGNRILKLDIDLRLKDGGNYIIKYKPVCFQDDEELKNTQIYKPNDVLFQAGADGYYKCVEPIAGGKVIDLCEGVIIDYHYEDSLNVNNFSMDFVIVVEKI